MNTETITVPRELLELLLARDSLSQGDCRCIYHSHASELEYESGTCPHQKLRRMLREKKHEPA